MYKNNEGYTDNTAGEAIERADRPPHAVRQVIYILRLIASLAGMEIVGRVGLRTRKRGGNGIDGRK